MGEVIKRAPRFYRTGDMNQRQVEMGVEIGRDLNFI